MTYKIFKEDKEDMIEVISESKKVYSKQELLDKKAEIDEMLAEFEK